MPALERLAWPTWLACDIINFLATPLPHRKGCFFASFRLNAHQTNMDQKQFLEKAEASGKPTVVDFWAPWCAPCRMTKPMLEKLAKEYHDEVNFWPVNANEQQGLLQELRIYAIPTVLLVQDGKIAGRFTGAQREATYRRMFEALANEGINIRMISTSEIKISVVVDEKYLELGVRALHSAFGLDEKP